MSEFPMLLSWLFEERVWNMYIKKMFADKTRADSVLNGFKYEPIYVFLGEAILKISLNI